MPMHEDCKTARMLMLLKVIHKGTIDFAFMLVLLMIMLL